MWLDVLWWHSCEFFMVLPSFKNSYFGLWWSHSHTSVATTYRLSSWLICVLSYFMFILRPISSKWERVVVKCGGSETLVSRFWLVEWMLLYEMFKSKGLYWPWVDGMDDLNQNKKKSTISDLIIIINLLNTAATISQLIDEATNRNPIG